MRRLHRRSIGLGVLVVCLLANIAVLSLFTPTAQAVLPPRPTVTTPSTGSNTPSDSDDALVVVPSVEVLYLNVTPADRQYWSIVQWQDADGRWQDVQGWRGEISGGTARWWVESRDFGKGPFRWVLYNKEGGTLLATSYSFNLPTQSRPVGVYLYLE